MRLNTENKGCFIEIVEVQIRLGIFDQIRVFTRLNVVGTTINNIREECSPFIDISTKGGLGIEYVKKNFLGAKIVIIERNN